MKPKIIMHGGANDRHKNEPERKRDVEKACKFAHRILLKKGALDAVEAAICMMESSEFLNAGRGSYLQLDGIVRMDAAIMTGDLRAGSVINIEDVEHPISVARRVMESTQHVILSGRLATEFARTEGFPRYDPRTRTKMNLWMDIMDEFRARASDEKIFHVDRHLESPKRHYGTVGCVCIDAKGNLAAGTSSGGRRLNAPGRVGDSAVIGAGTYCCAHGGVSCTGVGEKILVLSLAKTITDYLQYEKLANASDAAAHGIEQLNTIDAKGGVIFIDRKGNISHAFNTECMTMYYID